MRPNSAMVCFTHGRPQRTSSRRDRRIRPCRRPPSPRLPWRRDPSACARCRRRWRLPSRARGAARPMPRLAPVTSVTLSLSRMAKIPEGFSAPPAAPVSLVGLSKSFGGTRALDASRSRSRRARCTCSPAKTAPGRARSFASWRGPTPTSRASSSSTVAPCACAAQPPRSPPGSPRSTRSCRWSQPSASRTIWSFRARGRRLHGSRAAPKRSARAPRSRVSGSRSRPRRRSSSSRWPSTSWSRSRAPWRKRARARAGRADQRARGAGGRAPGAATRASQARRDRHPVHLASAERKSSGWPIASPCSATGNASLPVRRASSSRASWWPPWSGAPPSRSGAPSLCSIGERASPCMLSQPARRQRFIRSTSCSARASWSAWPASRARARAPSCTRSSAMVAAAGRVELDGEPCAPSGPRAALERGVALLAGDRGDSVLAALNVAQNGTLSSLRAHSPSGVLRRAEEERAVAPEARRVRLKAPRGRARRQALRRQPAEGGARSLSARPSARAPARRPHARHRRRGARRRARALASARGERDAVLFVAPTSASCAVWPSALSCWSTAGSW